MAPPELPPRKKKSPQPAPTTIVALGDDLLREVFLRLPSLPSLVRAALACPGFHRAVRSSPSFRRRFRDLHSPSLLGVFLVKDEPATPTFAPVLLRRRHRRSDPDHNAALRGLDVFLTLLPDAAGDEKEDAEDEDEEDVKDEDDGVAEDEDEEEEAAEVEDEEHDEDKEEEDEDEEVIEDEDENDMEEEEELMLFSSKNAMEYEEEDDDPGWSMAGCSNGYLLLVTPQWNTKKVAVYDPITRALHLFPGPPDELFSGDHEDTEAEFHVISSEGDDRSFRVLCVCKENGGAQVAVASPDNREWQISPTAGRLPDEGNGTLVNGFVYWASADGDNVLNTATLQFSQIDLPADMTGFSYSPEMSKVGETNDGKLCVVRGSDLQLDVWVRRAGKDGVDKWMREKKFLMVDAIDKLALNIIDECPALNVVAIVSGIVYFSIHQNDPPSWLLSFCLETRELKKLCPITRYEFCYPYIMAWPPSLVRNKVGAV